MAVKKGWAKERVSNSYAVDEGTLLASTSDQAVNMGTITIGQQALIINDGTSLMTIRFNSIANDSFTVNAGETYYHEMFEFNSIYISNPGVRNITYRIMITGL